MKCKKSETGIQGNLAVAETSAFLTFPVVGIRLSLSRYVEPGSLQTSLFDLTDAQAVALRSMLDLALKRRNR